MQLNTKWAFISDTNDESIEFIFKFDEFLINYFTFSFKIRKNRY